MPVRRALLKVAPTALAAPFVVPGLGLAQAGDALADDPTLATLTPTSTGGPRPTGANTLTIRWFGCANHELAFRDKVILLDAWYDRGPRNRPILATADVKRADLIINGHA